MACIFTVGFPSSFSSVFKFSLLYLNPIVNIWQQTSFIFFFIFGKTIQRNKTVSLDLLSRNKTMVELTSWKSKRLKSLISMICCFCWCWMFLFFLSLYFKIALLYHIKSEQSNFWCNFKIAIPFLVYSFHKKIVLMRRYINHAFLNISDNNHETYWSGYDKFRNWIFFFKMQFLNNKNLKLMRRKKYGKSLNSIYNFFTFFFPNLFFLSFLLQKIILEWLMDDTKWGKKSY